MIARSLGESDSPSARVTYFVRGVIYSRARCRQTGVCLGGSMSCPKCSHDTKVIGTEKNKRIFYCERCDILIKEKKLEDQVEMS